MASLGNIRRQITSITNTRKITRAMQMVSASKMRKSQQAVLKSRVYASEVERLASMLNDLSGNVDFPLLNVFEKARRIAVIIYSTNRGLVGSFNLNLINELKSLENIYSDYNIDLITYGKKGSALLSRLGKNILADFSKPDQKPQALHIYPLSFLVNKLYLSGDYAKVFVLYNHFHSTLSQKPNVIQVAPLTGEENYKSEVSSSLASPKSDYLFEPSPSGVLKHLLPRILEAKLYHALLESEASEHSARMIMMKNATDAAGDLIDEFTLTFNQLRQAKITTELSEITAGKIALENR